MLKYKCILYSRIRLQTNDHINIHFVFYVSLRVFFSSFVGLNKNVWLSNAGPARFFFVCFKFEFPFCFGSYVNTAENLLIWQGIRQSLIARLNLNYLIMHTLGMDWHIYHILRFHSIVRAGMRIGFIKLFQCSGSNHRIFFVKFGILICIISIFDDLITFILI